MSNTNGLELFVVKQGNAVVAKGFGSKPAAKAERNRLNEGLETKQYRVSKGKDHRLFTGI